MEIMRKGKLPEAEEYTIVCGNCDCMFKFTRREARLQTDDRDGDFLEINCPTVGCAKVCTTTPKNQRTRGIYWRE